MQYVFTYAEVRNLCSCASFTPSIKLWRGVKSGKSRPNAGVRASHAFNKTVFGSSTEAMDVSWAAVIGRRSHTTRILRAHAGVRVAKSFAKVRRNQFR